MHTPPIHVAIIGLGAWGTRLTRVAISLGAIVHGYDGSADRRHQASLLYPTLIPHTSLRSILSDRTIVAVIVATPSETHYKIAKRVLEAHKHTLVEKPLTQGVTGAGKLIRLAKQGKRVLMTDHTFLYSEALVSAKHAMDRGELGRITGVTSRRLGGKVRQHSSVLWDLATHDVAIFNYLAGNVPKVVRTDAKRTSSTRRAAFTLIYPNDVRMNGLVSWTASKKIRDVTITGTRGTCIVNWDGGAETCIVSEGNRKKILKASRSEPLRNMMVHFFRSLTRSPSQTLSTENYNVVRVVSALHRSWNHEGRQVSV